MTLSVLLVGCGGLGGALARGLGQVPGIELTLLDRTPDKAERLRAHAPRARIAHDLASAVARVEVAVFAVKPRGVAAALSEAAQHCRPGTLLVSCAAGVSLAALEAVRQGSAVARVMPNVGAAHQACTTGVLLGAGCEESRDFQRIEAIFGAVGQVRRLRDEAHLHAVTALSGSGPAFLLLALEAMEDAGVAQGLTREEARFFAGGACRAAAALVAEGIHEPASLRAQITSPGGTTIAGLAELEMRAARGAFLSAVSVASERSRSLS